MPQSRGNVQNCLSTRLRTGFVVSVIAECSVERHDNVAVDSGNEPLRNGSPDIDQDDEGRERVGTISLTNDSRL